MSFLGADADPNSFPSDDDSDAPHLWTLAIKTPATVVHALAMLATIFRLLYRWHLTRLSWEDTWATLALMCDIGCFASIWMQTHPGTSHTMPLINHRASWLLSLTLTSIVWFARMSILSSVFRIANPTSKLRLVAYCVGAMFLAMDAGLLAQKVFLCLKNFCRFTSSVGIAQLITDIISDTILVAVPIRFLRDMRLPRDHRILVISAFSASMLITCVTILHSALLFQEITNTTMVIGHVRAALALFVCNALVLVPFVYRMCHKSTPYFENHVGSHVAEFTSVIDLPGKFSSGFLPATSGVQSRGDAAPTMMLTLNASAGPELDPPHIRSPAAHRDPEDSKV